MLWIGKAKEKARLAAEAQQREEAWDPSFETQVKKGICCCFGLKVEKEQARLVLEAQALPISSYVYIGMFSALEVTRGLFALDWNGEGESTACC